MGQLAHKLSESNIQPIFAVTKKMVKTYEVSGGLVQCGDKAISAGSDKPGPALCCFSSAFLVGLWVVGLPSGHSFLSVSILMREVETVVKPHRVHVLKFHSAAPFFCFFWNKAVCPPAPIPQKEASLSNQHSNGAKLIC